MPRRLRRSGRASGLRRKEPVPEIQDQRIRHRRDQKRRRQMARGVPPNRAVPPKRKVPARSTATQAPDRQTEGGRCASRAAMPGHAAVSWRHPHHERFWAAMSARRWRNVASSAAKSPSIHQSSTRARSSPMRGPGAIPRPARRPRAAGIAAPATIAAEHRACASATRAGGGRSQHAPLPLLGPIPVERAAGGLVGQRLPGRRRCDR